MYPAPHIFAVPHKINYAHVRAENPLLRPRITCPSRNSTQTCAPPLIYLLCHTKSLTLTHVQKTHSFDLVSPAPHVTACNMASVPLESASVDVAVFSLALMGTDYGLFLLEATRVLRHKGWLWIAEVRVCMCV